MLMTSSCHGRRRSPCLVLLLHHEVYMTFDRQRMVESLQYWLATFEEKHSGDTVKVTLDPANSLTKFFYCIILHEALCGHGT